MSNVFESLIKFTNSVKRVCVWGGGAALLLHLLPSLTSLVRRSCFCRGESPSLTGKLPVNEEKEKQREKNNAKLCCATKLSYKMASFNRKQWEWRRARDCTAFTSLSLFQFQPWFSLFCEKAQIERWYLPLPLLSVLSSALLPQPSRKWSDWHEL